MKKLFSIIFLLVITITLASCSSDLPELKLKGDAIITINQGEEFTDPGVDIIGDFDIDVTTTSTVDVTIPGSYKIDYTIIYNDVEYKVSRSVVVLDPLLESIELSIHDYAVTSELITFSILYTDTDNLLSNLMVVLYEGETIIDSKPFTVGDFEYSFDTFKPSTTYKLALEGTYTVNGFTKAVEGYFVEFTTPTTEDIVPVLSLHGDEEIYVNVYDTFTDLGAYISNGVLGTISTTSTVDTATMGDYTVTYSVTHNDEVISVTRTVHVIDFYSLLGSLEVSYLVQETTENTITVSVSFNDSNGYLKNFKIGLYQDSSLVESYDLITGDNTIIFSNLTPGTLYEVELNGTYNDGSVVIELENYTAQAQTDINKEPTVTIGAETINPQLYETTVTIVDEFDTLVNATLSFLEDGEEYSSDSLVVGNNVISYNYINPETTYEVKVTYTYYNEKTSSNEEKTILLSTITTPVRPMPSYSDECTVTTSSVTCIPTVGTTGFSNVSLYFMIFEDGQLYHYETFTDFTTGFVVTGLSAGTDYLVKGYISYTDDASGVEYSSVLVNEGTVSTEAPDLYTTPTVENMVITKDLDSDTKTFVFEFDLIDPDGAIEGLPTLRLTLGGSTQVEVLQVGHNVITYEGYFVKENAEYSFIVQTDYRASADEYLNYQHLYEDEFFTAITIPVVDFTSVNTNFEGNEVILKVVLDNETEMDINYIKINGIEYSNFMFHSNLNEYYINIGTVTSAQTINYSIEAISVDLVNETEHLILPNSVISVIIHEPGTFIPDTATIKVLDMTTSDYAVQVPDTDVYDDNYTDRTVFIHIENDYNLPITSINVDGVLYTSSDFTIANNVISLSVEIRKGGNGVDLYDITFERNGVEYDYRQPGIESMYIYGYIPEDIVYISSVADFLAIDPSETKYYKLQTNLDFTGVTMTPLGDSYDNYFHGTFDGNGFVMSNITITNNTNIENKSKYVGLFGYVGGFLLDVHVSNINITVTNSNSINTQSYVGGLAGLLKGNIYNSKITGNSSITINGLNSGDIGGLVGSFGHYSSGTIRDSSANMDITIDGNNFNNRSYSVSVGGLVGICSTSEIFHSYSTGSITITNTDQVSYFVGGLAGTFYGQHEDHSYVSHSYSSVDISTTNNYYGRVGGLVGQSSNLGIDTTILNSYSFGDVFSSAGRVGGIVGNDANIENSMSFGTLSSTVANPGSQIGIGDYLDESIRDSRFIYINQEFYRDTTQNPGASDRLEFNYIVVTAVELNDVSFYIDFLNWNDYFYDFSNLDVANDEFPTFN